MRERRKLFDALGLRGFMTFVIGGNALVALAHPVRTRLGANAVNSSLSASSVISSGAVDFPKF